MRIQVQEEALSNIGTEVGKVEVSQPLPEMFRQIRVVGLSRLIGL